jgi:2-polyprenyl-3-methyl-5-hydroxy-6-metoxy-1,4-benzoquinol methylase
VKRDDLISSGYLDEQRILHAAPRGYGQRGDKWAKTVEGIVSRHHVSSVLDYGCGQGSLAAALPRLGIVEYDPAIEGKDAPPTRTFDLVVCTDVLEHVESDRIDAVATHLSNLSERFLLAVISLVPTSKTLTDGRQAHILLRSREWWRCLLEAHDFKLRAELASPDPNKSSKEFAAFFKRTARTV